MPFLKIVDKKLEYVWYGPGPNEAPTLYTATVANLSG